MKTQLLAVGAAMVLLAGAAHGAPLADPPGSAAAASPQVPAFDAKAESDVIAAVAKLLTDNYIYPDTGKRAAALIGENLRTGAYKGLDRDAFAKRLTDDLRSVTHDKHMWVGAGGPPGASGPGQEPPPSLFGFERADRLKGNIGYVRLNGFMPREAFAIGADQLMPKLAGTDALIIDMRDNHGGSPDAVSYFVSFFVAAGSPVHVNDLIWRKPGTEDYDRQVFSTSATPVSYHGKPVFLVTGPETFSGGEEFSYDMQVLKLATLVGETTGGGANPGGTQPVGAGLVMFLPSGRAENPITITSWEGTGVKPDVATPTAQAFATAYAAALKAAHQPVIAADTPDAVVTDPLLVLRTQPYPQGEAYIRRQVEGLVKGEQPFDIFSPGMAEALKGPVPQATQDTMKAQGALKRIAFVRVDPFGADEYDVTFEKGEQIWTMAINGAGKIVFAFFRPK